MKVQNIETIKRKYERDREWLLIRVHKIDESTTTVLTGELLAHSPHRYDIYQKLRELKPKGTMYVTCSVDSMPRGYVAAF